MTNFKIGQKVVCIKNGNYISLDSGEIDNTNAPKKNEIVTINHITLINKIFFLQLKEYLYCVNGDLNYINEKNFKPIIYENINHEIVSQLKTIDERCDVEIKQIETIETIKQ